MHMRKLAAFLIAPLIPSLIVSAVMVVSGHADGIQFAILAGVFVGYPVAIVFGPIVDYFIFSKSYNRNPIQIMLWTGIITAVLISALFISESFGPFGLQVAFSPAFWLYVPIFWGSFFVAVWCFLRIAYGTLH